MLAERAIIRAICVAHFILKHLIQSDRLFVDCKFLDPKIYLNRHDDIVHRK